MWCLLNGQLFVVLLILNCNVFPCESQILKGSRETPEDVEQYPAELLEEIAALRKKLSKAFENLEEHDDLHENPKDRQRGDAKSKQIRISDQGLKEAAKLREEIQTAIENDVYIASSYGTTAHVKEIDQHFQMNQRSRELLAAMISEASSSTAIDENTLSSEYETIVTGDEFNVSGDGSDEDGAGSPNIIDANAGSAETDIDIRKLQKLEVSKRRTREVLILKSIEEDLTFQLGEDVVEWEHVINDGQEYFIGRRETDLILIRKDAIKYEKGHVLEVGQPIAYLETFTYWNYEMHTQQSIILVAAREQIIWYLGNGQTIWNWNVGMAISALKYFEIDSREYLVVSSNQSSRIGYYSLNIYQFDKSRKEFWIVQRMQLQHPCSKVTLLDTGRDIVLAVAQRNTAAIYTFNPRTSNVEDRIHFQLLKAIPSEQIEAIVAFQMGGHNYLALGGKRPQILHYSQGDFVPVTIFGHNFGVVELFFPIPARTYRDDLILLVQHRVDFSSHQLVVLEALIWNGDVFEASIPVPCKLGAHTMYGVSCMLDIQRDAGLKGAALLRRGDEISIIVPRHRAVSGLFRIHTELLAKNSELLDLQEIFDFLKGWVQEQDDLIEDAHEFLARHEQGHIAPKDYSNLELLETPELKYGGEIGDIYINDWRWTTEDSNLSLDQLIDALKELEVELDDKRNRREVFFESLDVDQVDVDELFVEFFNGKEAFVKNNELIFDGTVKLDSLEVLEERTNRKSRQFSEDMLEIDGNVEFEEINGIRWDDFIEGIVFRDVPSKIQNLTVKGEIIVEDKLTIDTLNSLKFPDDYLWSSGPTTSVVRAEKNFLGTLAATAVDTGGPINGVDPFDIITLSESQSIPGLTTFTQLEVSEQLELNGTVHGKRLGKFLANPSLLESHVIHSALNFRHLEVDGPVHVNGKYNNLDLDALLGDVVQIPAALHDAEISIPSAKTFTAVTFPDTFELTQNTVSGIPSENFVTKNTQQDLDISEIRGFVYFSNLTIGGTFDSVNVSELLTNSVKIDQDQRLTDVELRFLENPYAESMHILKHLNGDAVATDFQTLDEDLVSKEVFFDILRSEKVQVDGDILGSGLLNELNLKEFIENQPFFVKNGNFFINKLILDAGLQADTLYGINADFLLGFLDKIDNIPAMILEGKIQVDSIIVEGDVQVNKLNGHHFDQDIQLNVIWLNQTNFLRTNLNFVESLEVHGDLNVEGMLNGVDFPKFIADIVFKSNNSSPIVLGAKTFTQNVVVLGNTVVTALNGIPFEEIATKQTANQFRETIKINGNLFAETLEIDGFLNDYPLASLTSRCRYDKDLKSFVLLGDIPLPGDVSVDDLFVHGNLNDIDHVNGFFKNLIYNNGTNTIHGVTVFKGNVTIENGAHIKQLNGYNLEYLLENIVLIDDPRKVVISAPVIFEDEVHATQVTVNSSLKANNLLGCSLADWLRNSLRLDLPANIGGYLHFDAGALDGNSLNVAFLNGVNMDNLITLNSAQNFSSHLTFSDVHLVKSITTKNGLVNGVHLQSELNNTLMVNGDQHITTPLTMRSCRVLENLQTNALVNNNKDLRQLVRIDKDQDIQSPISFQEVTARNVLTNDTISAINFDDWYKNTLWREGREQQVISGNWSTKKLQLFSTNLTIMESFKDQLTYSKDVEALQQNYMDICQSTAKLLDMNRNGIFFPKYFELALTLVSLGNTSAVNHIFPIDYQNESYLVLNSACNSRVYQWNAERGNFMLISELISGAVDQVIVVRSQNDDTELRLITNTGSVARLNCTFTGMNAWKLRLPQQTYPLHNYGDSMSTIYQTSGRPGKFYAIDDKKRVVVELGANSTDRSRSWDLPAGHQDDIYRFYPTDHDKGKMVLLNQRNNRTSNDSARSESVTHRAPLTFPAPIISQLEENSSETQTMSFLNFCEVIERILHDMVKRLDVEINAIQLTIHETDLYDDRLQEDFFAILQEIHERKLIPTDDFIEVSADMIELPAQIIAVRMLEIIWPVIVEIGEMHSNLYQNETTDPISACIFSSLGAVIRDLLVENFAQKNNDTIPPHTDRSDMTIVISHIRNFQQEILRQLEKLLEAMKESFDVATEKPTRSLNSAKPQFKSVTKTTTENPFNASIFRGTLSGDILALQVGSIAMPRTLLATVESKRHLKVDEVKIYFDDITRSLFQTIPTNKVHHHLAAMRIRDHTLLAFVEDRSFVRVMTYRGIQGFVDFVKFRVNGEISALTAVSLASSRPGGDKRHFFSATIHNRVEFYEAIMSADGGDDGKIECIGFK